MSFNVSHSHGCAAFAIARGREVGIDLEWIRADIEVGQIAKRFFSEREKATLLALPDDQKKRAFFACWTRKEAYVKARGEGLALLLDRFDVSFVDGQPAAVLVDRGSPTEVYRWSLRDLPVMPGYAAAIAVEGNEYELQCRPLRPCEAPESLLSESMAGV
jgi:4'-phosphopantetheinyl transferase